MGQPPSRKKVKQVVLGEKRDYFVLHIATDQLTVFVPIDTIDLTIRPVISKTAAGRVLKLFKTNPRKREVTGVVGTKSSTRR